MVDDKSGLRCTCVASGVNSLDFQGMPSFFQDLLPHGIDSSIQKYGVCITGKVPNPFAGRIIPAETFQVLVIQTVYIAY